jgi:hypothetical protein
MQKTSVTGDQDTGSLRVRAAGSLHQLAVATLVGALSGAVVVSIGGRHAMGLLALMNPQAAGLISDDGFMMGLFTWSGTLELLHTGTSVGLIGGLLYLGLRAALAERARLRRPPVHHR